MFLFLEASDSESSSEFNMRFSACNSSSFIFFQGSLLFFISEIYFHKHFL